MDPEKETQVLEPELDEQDQETQESRKQASANDGDKTQTLLYRLWLKRKSPAKTSRTRRTPPNPHSRSRLRSSAMRNKLHGWRTVPGMAFWTSGSSGC